MYSDGAWSYKPDLKPHQLIDLARCVQIQFQLHATGAPVGYLCSFSLSQGMTVFKVKYSSAFMEAASKYLQLIVPKYLARNQPLPFTEASGDFGLINESSEVQDQHEKVLDALADTTVEPLGPQKDSQDEERATLHCALTNARHRCPVCLYLCKIVSCICNGRQQQCGSYCPAGLMHKPLTLMSKEPLWAPVDIQLQRSETGDNKIGIFPGNDSELLVPMSF